MKFYATVLFAFLLFGCSSSKNIEKVPTAEEMENLKEGFVKGTIKVEPTGGACPYLIEVEAETTYYLDPINLMEYYQKDGKKIWFKYRGLKMMNRCEKGNPVSISEIKERSE